jgi:hypothetical protein
MQISRHWRLNAQRYRLEGYRSTNGSLSLRPRPIIQEPKQTEAEIEIRSQEKVLILSY